MTHEQPAFAPFTSLDELTAAAQEQVGAKLFTVSAVSADGQEVVRLVSTVESVYALGGRKPAGDLVAEQEAGTSFFPTRAEIEALFPDHEIILAMGCSSSVNVPVIHGGAMIGALNFLDAEGTFSADSIRAAEALALRSAEVVARYVATGL